MPAKTKSKTNSPTPGLTPLAEHRLRIALRRSAPSEPWVDAQFKSFTDTDPNGKTIVYRFHDTTIFPPGGRRLTPMPWCRSCGRYTPRNCIHLIEHRRSLAAPIHSATLHCDDCRIADDTIRFREIYDANPHLRPAPSFSFFRLATLISERRQNT